MIDFKIKDGLTSPTPMWAKKARTIVYRIGGIPALIGLVLWVIRSFFPEAYSVLPSDLTALEDTLLVGGIGGFILNMGLQMTGTNNNIEKQEDKDNA